MEGLIYMNNLQSDKNPTKQIRIDTGLHRILKVKAAKSGMTIKMLLEEYLTELLSPLSDEKIQKEKSNGELQTFNQIG
jgi:hypothetical protein